MEICALCTKKRAEARGAGRRAGEFSQILVLILRLYRRALSTHYSVICLRACLRVDPFVV